MVVAESEVAKALQQIGLRDEYVIVAKTLFGSSHGIRKVWDVARNELKHQKLTEVVLVVHPQDRKRAEAEAYEFRINHRFDRLIGPIGYDRHSLDWETRSNLHSFLFRISQKTKRYKGYQGVGF